VPGEISMAASFCSPVDYTDASVDTAAALFNLSVNPPIHRRTALLPIATCTGGIKK